MESKKRGRKLSQDTTDERILQRRRQTCGRVAAYRARKAASNPQTSQQIEQAEAIIQVPYLTHEIRHTSPALGLRVRVDIPEDIEDAQLQQQVDIVDEHESLYPPRNAPEIDSDTGDLSDDIGFSLDQPSPPHSQSIPHRTYNYQEREPANFIHEHLEIVSPRNSVTSNIDEAQDHWDSDASSFAGFSDASSPQLNSGLDESPFTGFANADDIQSNGDTDENSFTAFASEYEEEDEILEHDDEISEITPLQYTVEKIYLQLQHGFHGCTEEEHNEAMRKHMQEAGDNHYRLSSTCHGWDEFPHVLGQTDAQMAQPLRDITLPSKELWSDLFCGFDPDNEDTEPRPRNICLHKEETREMAAGVAWDIDSCLGFASSFAMAKQGLQLSPTPQMRTNITQDIHITATVPSADSEETIPARPTMLRKIPHFLIGRVEEAHGIDVYALFPHLPFKGDTFVSLTQQQLSRWTDRILNPSLHRHCQAHYTQHIPSSYKVAFSNSKAHQVERRRIMTSSYQSRQDLSYFIQPDILDKIWTDILAEIDRSQDLQDFREPQIFFSAKGTKLKFKSTTSEDKLIDVMKSFMVFFNKVIDTDYVYLDRLYIDIGKEICAKAGYVRRQSMPIVDQPQVYQWKRCCLEHYMNWMYDGTPPSMNGEGQRFFQQNLLRDACNLTSVTPMRSTLRKGGLIYSQFYSSVKEVVDAAKCFPFDNEDLEELALDPEIHRGVQNIVGGRYKDLRVLLAAYRASKARTRDALEDSQRKSYGIREEHRVSWNLVWSLIERLEIDEIAAPTTSLVDCPSYAWPIQTRAYFKFLWTNVNKFAAGFEIVKAQSSRGHTTWEETKSMAMFLRCLQFVLGGHLLQRESALWWSKSTRTVGNASEERIWYGLGFRNTLQRYGYCWIEPRIDWENIIFDPAIADRVLFGNGLLRKRYLQQRGKVTDFIHTIQLLEQALEWLGRYHMHAIIRRQLMHWMVYICLEQFRRDVMSMVKEEILEVYREDALLGNIPFCYERLSEIMGRPLHLVSGNRSDYKQVHDLGTYLFGYNDQKDDQRKHWKDKPFRKLYKFTSEGVQGLPKGGKLRNRFQEIFWQYLYAHHWILPYPQYNGLTQTTKQGLRIWYSIGTTVEPASGGLILTAPKCWSWYKRNHRPGQPPLYPEYTNWETEDWRRWIEIEAERGERIMMIQNASQPEE